VIEIRALREGDDRSQFQSGDTDLDRFFQKFAGQNQFRHYIGVTVDVVEGQSDARPQPTPMFLSMRAIKGALGLT
jgi:hypothetical protein